MIAIVTIKSVYFTEIYMHVRKTKELVNTATVTSCGWIDLSKYSTLLVTPDLTLFIQIVTASLSWTACLRSRSVFNITWEIEMINECISEYCSRYKLLTCLHYNIVCNHVNATFTSTSLCNQPNFLWIPVQQKFKRDTKVTYSFWCINKNHNSITQSQCCRDLIREVYMPCRNTNFKGTKGRKGLINTNWTFLVKAHGTTVIDSKFQTPSQTFHMWNQV